MFFKRALFGKLLFRCDHNDNVFYLTTNNFHFYHSRAKATLRFRYNSQKVQLLDSIGSFAMKTNIV